MSPILILILALAIYAGFTVLRARNREEMRAREVETEARLAAEAERISREGERQEMLNASARSDQGHPRSP